LFLCVCLERIFGVKSFNLKIGGKKILAFREGGPRSRNFVSLRGMLFLKLTTFYNVNYFNNRPPMFIRNFPNLRQTRDFDCGATALQAVLAYYGIDERIDKIMKLVGTTKAGTPIKKINKTAEKYKLKAKMDKMAIEDIKKYIAQKIPVLLLIQAWPENKTADWENGWDNGHYVIAIGYDKEKIYFEDPESIYRTYLTYEELEKRWHDMVSGKKYINYGIAVCGKKPQWRPNKIIHMN